MRIAQGPFLHAKEEEQGERQRHSGQKEEQAEPVCQPLNVWIAGPKKQFMGAAPCHARQADQDRPENRYSESAPQLAQEIQQRHGGPHFMARHSILQSRCRHRQERAKAHRQAGEDDFKHDERQAVGGKPEHQR